MKFITPDGKEIVSFPKLNKIETNQAYCFICKSFLESTNIRGFVQCKCGRAIDGGLEYQRSLGKTASFRLFQHIEKLKILKIN